MRVDEWMRMASSRLAASGSQEFGTESQILAGHILLRDRAWVLAHPEAEIDELPGESLLTRRESGEPLAYILGYREFYGRRFAVRPGVLIPRQETEVLVETALAGLAKGGPVLDIGVGSGAIAITLKLERPDTAVTGVDISPKALEIARENAENLGADVRFFESDLFQAVEGEKFDLVVSNPPYVAKGDVLPREVSDFEPAQALFADDDGLAIYKRLAGEGKHRCAKMIVELGAGQAPAVRGLFEKEGWTMEKIVPDLAGIDRVAVFLAPSR